MKIVNLITLLCFLCNIAFADCNWKTGITFGPNKTFIYNEACHQKVGELIEQNKNQAQAISDLNKAVSLKDLSLKDSDERAQKWSDTSSKLEERLEKIDDMEKKDNILYFVLGAGLVIGSGIMAATLIKR